MVSQPNNSNWVHYFDTCEENYRVSFRTVAGLVNELETRASYLFISSSSPDHAGIAIRDDEYDHYVEPGILGFGQGLSR